VDFYYNFREAVSKVRGTTKRREARGFSCIALSGTNPDIVSTLIDSLLLLKF